MSLALSATQSSPTCTEHELVDAVRAGSDRAFEELYSRYQARIGSYIAGMVGDHARAEDIAQEVFISALRRLRKTDRPVVFKPWIYEIAKNACIDEFRRNKRAREVPLDDDEDSDTGHRWISTAATPDVAIERKQSLHDLQGAFHVLSDSHHKVMVLREFEGLSYDQIGERMGMSKATVESTLFRARRRLSEEYNELVSGRRCEHVQELLAEHEPSSLLKLRVRERRLLARHLSHCQPCRLEARMAGLDDSLFQAPSFAGKVAALLPIPWLRWRRGGGQRSTVAGPDDHAFALLQPLQTVARLGDMVGASTGLGRAVAAAAALAVAGLGGGVVSAVASHGQSAAATPVAAQVSAPSTARGGGTPSSSRSAATASDTHRLNKKLWTSAGQGLSQATSVSAGAAPRSASNQSSGGSGSGSRPRGSSSSGQRGGLSPISRHSSLLTLPVIGRGSSSKPLLSGVAKLVKPILPKIVTPSPAQIQLPHLPSVGGSGGKPSLPRIVLPNPSKLLP